MYKSYLIVRKSKVLSDFESSFPFTEWGRIAWEKSGLSY